MKWVKFALWKIAFIAAVYFTIMGNEGVHNILCVASVFGAILVSLAMCVPVEKVRAHKEYLKITTPMKELGGLIQTVCAMVLIYHGFMFVGVVTLYDMLCSYMIFLMVRQKEEENED